MDALWKTRIQPMHKNEQEKLLSGMEETLRQGDSRIDTMLAEIFLRASHPECEEALVSALENARRPIRTASIQKAREIMETMWAKIDECETKTSAVMGELVALTIKVTDHFLNRMGSTSEGIHVILESAGIDDTEKRRQCEALLDASEKERETFLSSIKGEQDALMARLREINEIPAAAEKEVEAAFMLLPEEYVRDCEEKSRAVYEEFLV